MIGVMSGLGSRRWSSCSRWARRLAPLQPQVMLTFRDENMDQVVAIVAQAGFRFNTPRRAAGSRHAFKVASKRELHEQLYRDVQVEHEYETDDGRGGDGE